MRKVRDRQVVSLTVTVANFVACVSQDLTRARKLGINYLCKNYNLSIHNPQTLPSKHQQPENAINEQYTKG